MSHNFKRSKKEPGYSSKELKQTTVIIHVVSAQARKATTALSTAASSGKLPTNRQSIASVPLLPLLLQINLSKADLTSSLSHKPRPQTKQSLAEIPPPPLGPSSLIKDNYYT